jgi:hypothetical protein
MFGFVPQQQVARKKLMFLLKNQPLKIFSKSLKANLNEYLFASYAPKTIMTISGCTIFCHVNFNSLSSNWQLDQSRQQFDEHKNKYL